MTLRTLLCCLASAVAPAVTPAQTVWVVAPAPGTGVHFTVIQDAVDAAADGDVILVRQGTYAPFDVDAKALLIAGDGGRVTLAAATATGVLIRNLGAGQSVALRSFSVSAIEAAPIGILDCQGPVLVEDCDFSSALNVFVGPPGATVQRSPRVTFVRATLTGGAAARNSPGAGLDAFASTVTLHHCTVTGGRGNGQLPTGGAAGAYVVSGSLIAADTELRGGSGDLGFSIGGPCLFPPTGGGDALVLANAPATAYLLGCTLTPGAAGYAPPGCLAANPGTTISGLGSATSVAGPIGTLTANSPARAGQALDLDFFGPQGAAAWLLLAAKQSPFFVPACHGTVHVDLAGAVTVPIGVLPNTGKLSLHLTVPSPLGVSGLGLHLQMVLTQPAGCFLGTASAVLLLDRGF